MARAATPAGHGPCVLVLNAGSSSIRVAVHEITAALPLVLHGSLDRIGMRGSMLALSAPGTPTRRTPVATATAAAAVNAVLAGLETHPAFDAVVAVGHRVVHGMAHARPQRITQSLLGELRRIAPFVPEHLPRALTLITAMARRHQGLPQVACFDTTFHHAMPRVATLIPLPRHVTTGGMRRYGFHGLSYASLLKSLASIDTAAAQGRVILAHLGNGASLAAVHRGRSIDTTMGFTPTGGLVMGTRSGDLDPGLLYYLAREHHLSAARLRTMVNEESGLLGVSGTSADMRDLLDREAGDARAAEAVALFCYQVRKAVGTYSAALGGVDTLVFSGGIGEHAAVVRARICEGLAFLGITLDGRRNAAHAPLVSSGRVAVRVIPTDEARVIATDVVSLLGLDRQGSSTAAARGATRRGRR